MDALVVFAIFILSLAVTIIKSPAKALLNVYLFVLLLTPSTLSFKLIEGIPSLSMGQAAILPICLFSLVTSKIQFSWTDILVLGFVITASISDFVNDGYKLAQNTTYFNICAIVFPYLAGKQLITKRQLDVKFAKRFVSLSAICALTMGYEFLTGKNLYVQVFWQFFHQVHTFGDTRFFFRRASGPFVHSIIACIAMSSAFFLHSWLVLFKELKRKFLGMRLSTWIYAALGLGMLTPLSRGPLLGWFCGLFVFSYGIKSFMARLLRMASLAIMLLGFLYVYNIQEIIETSASDELAQSAYYRRVLWDTYWEDLMQNIYLGVGSLNLEAKNSQGSIDNAYMYIALLHGIFRLVFYFLIVLNLALRLIFRLRQALPLAERQLVYTFLSLITLWLVSFGTVWISGEMMSILFLLYGWMEGYLLAKKKPQFSDEASLPLKQG